MASKNSKTTQPSNPDLPVDLASAIESARKLIVPTFTEEEMDKLPHLSQFLTPMIVADPRYKGEGKPPRVLREPLGLLSFDRRAGAFKISLTDKILNLSGSCYVTTLLGALLDLEKELREGTFHWSERKVT